MAQKGWWGDKMIISLSSNDKKRQKKWCVYYRKSDKYCTEKICKCTGSAQCKIYQQKEGVGPIDYSTVPIDVPVVEVEPTVSNSFASPVNPLTYIPGHHPSFGEKLLGAIVLMKNTTGHILVGEVVFESYDFITVEKDDGSQVKYNRRVAISNKTFWVLDDNE